MPDGPMPEIEGGRELPCRMLVAGGPAEAPLDS